MADPQNVKINDLTLAGSVVDTMQFETDINGTTANKVTALQIKAYVGAVDEYDAIVGPIGSGADYNSIQDAIADSKYNILVIGNFTETQNVTVGANDVRIKIKETCNMATFKFTANGAGNIAITEGKILAGYTSNNEMFAFTGSGTLYLHNTVVDMTASTAGTATIATMGSSSKVLAHNSEFLLANATNAGFDGLYNGSSISDCSFVGGGSSCNNAVLSMESSCLYDNKFTGIFENSSNLITCQTTDSIIDGLLYRATNRPAINLLVDGNKLDNIDGDLTIDFNTSGSNKVSNCTIAGMDLSNASSNVNELVNVNITTESVTVGGIFNQFVNMNFVTIVVDGTANWFHHCRGTNMTYNGDDNQSLQCSYTNYTDNGTDNAFISLVSEDGTFATNSDRKLVTEKAIKTYVDNAIEVENLWDRVTGTPNYLQPHTVTDELASAGIPISKGYLTNIQTSTITDFGSGVTIQGINLDTGTIDQTSGATNLDITNTNGSINLTCAGGIFLNGNPSGVQINAGTFSLSTGTSVNEISTVVNSSSTDDQLITAKAVYDYTPTLGGVVHENLTISTPGQTAFTLGGTPITPSASIVTLNGQTRIYGAGADYTISGNTLTWNDPGGLTLQTTDDLQIWYNISISPPGSLDQDKVFYVAKAGSDGNDGKSIEKPFLTIGKAITEVNLQSPGFTNKWKIEIIDGGIYTQSFTVSDHTEIVGTGASVTGTITMGSYSTVRLRQVSGEIRKIGGAQSWVYIDEELSNATGRCIDQSGGSLYVECSRLINGLGAGYIRAAGPVRLHVKAREAYPGNIGTKIDCSGTSTSYFDFEYINCSTSGNFLTTADSCSVYINADNFTSISAYNLGGTSSLYLNTKRLTGTTTVGATANLYTSNVKSRFTARLTSSVNDVTGDGTGYNVIYNQEDTDVGGIYDHTTGIFTANASGDWQFNITLKTDNYVSGHNDALVALNTSSLGYVYLDEFRGYDVAAGTNRQVTSSAAVTLPLTVGDTVRVYVDVSGATKVVDVASTSYFSGRFIG